MHCNADILKLIATRAIRSVICAWHILANVYCNSPVWCIDCAACVRGCVCVSCPVPRSLNIAELRSFRTGGTLMSPLPTKLLMKWEDVGTDPNLSAASCSRFLNPFRLCHFSNPMASPSPCFQGIAPFIAWFLFRLLRRGDCSD